MICATWKCIAAHNWNVYDVSKTSDGDKIQTSAYVGKSFLLVLFHAKLLPPMDGRSRNKTKAIKNFLMWCNQHQMDRPNGSKNWLTLLIIKTLKKVNNHLCIHVLTLKCTKLQSFWLTATNVLPKWNSHHFERLHLPDFCGNILFISDSLHHDYVSGQSRRNKNNNFWLNRMWETSFWFEYITTERKKLLMPALEPIKYLMIRKQKWADGKQTSIDEKKIVCN